MEEGKDFVSLVKDNTKSKMFDDHLWLSVARRPQKSNFSRVQRWSMCLSTLYLTMVVNAMWYVYSYCGKRHIAGVQLSWYVLYNTYLVMSLTRNNVFFYKISSFY